MIYAKAKSENKKFFTVLKQYLDMIRDIHKRTYDLIGKQVAGSNPQHTLSGVSGRLCWAWHGAARRGGVVGGNAWPGKAGKARHVVVGPGTDSSGTAGEDWR